MPSPSTGKRKWIFIMLFGVILTLIAILTPYLLDRTLWDRLPVEFRDPAGDRLVGSYHPGKVQAGVLLLEGFGSDQVTMRSAASEFARDGYHLFTFDFSGHGRSPGTLGYDNAATSRLAYQALAAKEQFKTLSGLPDSQIIVLGHSLGARVALQSATLDPAPPAGLILLGTQVNLSANTQAEFFTGVSDADLAWVQALGPENPATNILLLSGEWDDILTPQAAGLLAEKLGGIPLAPDHGSGEFASATRRDFQLLPQLVHNYEVFSPRALSAAKLWTASAFGLVAPAASSTFAALRIACWILGFVGLIISLIGAASWLKSLKNPSFAGPQTAVVNIHILNLRYFLVAKLLLWLVALPFGAVLASVFFFLPIGLPTFNLIYVAFFGGYGILMLLLYRFGRMPGTRGRLPFRVSAGTERCGIWAALALTALILVSTAAFARTGWFFVYPMNVRLLWLVLFSLPTTLGFWIGSHEMELIERIAPGRWLPQIGALLIGILPFFIYTAFLAILGSLSGVIGGIQGLLILGLVLTFGDLLRQITPVHWLSAFCQAMLLYWLIIPQGVLFR